MAAPTEHASREYQAFLRGPSGCCAVGTVDAYRSSVWHWGRLAVIPEPADNELSDFGFQVGGGFTVEIADEPDGLDWPIYDEAYEFLLDEAGEALISE